VNTDNDTGSEGVRLQKVLADAGVGSRRNCEKLIAEGRVKVDGKVVSWFGARVDPAKAVIHVDGLRVETRPEMRYYAVNKPRGVVSTMSDERGRKSLADYVDVPERLFHVGRLDTDTEGLILLTNDASPRSSGRSRATWAAGCARASHWRTGWPGPTGSSWSSSSASGRWSR
jgi:23S rRNA-/tRNA-specific pseudouridylate synthase